MQDATETRINMVYENKILKKPSTLINKIFSLYIPKWRSLPSSSRSGTAGQPEHEELWCRPL